MIKAVFIDIDGTLLTSRREVTDNTKNIINKCIEKEIKIILSSGRSRIDTIEYQKLAGTSPYIISSNGAEAYDIENKTEIYSEPISKEVVKELLMYSQKNDYIIKFNYGSELVMNKNFYPDEAENIRTEKELLEIADKEKILQCVVSNKDFEKMKEFKRYLSKLNMNIKIENESKRLKNPELEPSKNYYCDVTSLLISKGKAVKKICEYLNLKSEEIAVIGDGENDISMFELTENSVAMGNAIEEVKEKAKFVTTSNDEEGVAKYLESIVN